MTTFHTITVPPSPAYTAVGFKSRIKGEEVGITFYWLKPLGYFYVRVGSATRNNLWSGRVPPDEAAVIPNLFPSDPDESDVGLFVVNKDGTAPTPADFRNGTIQMHLITGRFQLQGANSGT